MSVKKRVNKCSSFQIKFCEELANGKSQREAYKSAYPNNKRSDIVTDAAASRLLSNVKVFEYYQSLLKKSAEKSQITRDMQLKELEEIKAIAKANKDLKEWRATIETQNKMLGFNEPDKLDLTSKGESLKPAIQITVKNEEQKSIIEKMLDNNN